MPLPRRAAPAAFVLFAALTLGGRASEPLPAVYSWPAKGMAALLRRVERQIEPDGRQPLELARTKALNYSLLNLEGLFHLARLCDEFSVESWDFQSIDHRSIAVALRYLAPYADPNKPWPKKDLVAGDRSRLFGLMAESLAHHDDAQYRTLMGQFAPADARWRLFWPDAPAFAEASAGGARHG